jgi:hypothetical protein
VCRHLSVRRAKYLGVSTFGLLRIAIAGMLRSKALAAATRVSKTTYLCLVLAFICSLDQAWFTCVCDGPPLQIALRTQQRAYAEKAVAVEADWDAISSLIHSDEGKRELSSLRLTFLDIQTRLANMSKETPPPDWAAWRKELDPKIVDGFKQAFDSEFVWVRSVCLFAVLVLVTRIPPLPPALNDACFMFACTLLFMFHAAMKLPKYDGDEAAQAEAKFKEIMQQAEAFAATSASRIKEIEAELASIQREKERIATVTVDEELAADPKLAAEIDDEVQKNAFLVPP